MVVVIWGANTRATRSRFRGGGTATVDAKEMEDFFASCVQLYLELSPGATLRKVATPLLPEDQRDSPARAPAGKGPVEECPWCRHTFSPNPYSSVAELEKAHKAKRDTGGSGSSGAR